MPAENTGPILQSLGHMSAFFWHYGATLLALGALTVAVLEAWKKLRHTQAKFLRASVLRWLGNDEGERSSKLQHYATQAAPARSALAPFDAGRAYDQLLHLATGVGEAGPEHKRRHATSCDGDQHGRYERSIEYALFELEIDRLMGQVQDAADTALHNPQRYPDLFQFLTRSAAPDDVAPWLNDVQQLASQSNANEQLRKDLAERYTRVKQQVRRHLDSFQIITTMRWREWNQLAAVVVGALLMFTAQLLVLGHAGDGAWKPWADIAAQLSVLTLIKMVLVSLFGGMLAPVVKDLIDVLRRAK